MGWLIFLGVVTAYGGLGMLCVPFITRLRYQHHVEGWSCETCRGGPRTDEDNRECAASWASIAWLFWPLWLLTGIPKGIATGAMSKDAANAARLKVLEAEAAEQEKRVQRELSILRGNDPDTMTVADFDRKMLEDDTGKATKKGLSKYSRTVKEWQLANLGKLR